MQTMNLKDYLDQTGTTQDAFAKSVGVHKLTVSRWVRGERFPSSASQRTIAAVTDGAVTPVDWFGLEPQP